MRKIRYGLLGFGGIALNRIAREGFGLAGGSYRAPDHAELVAAGDMNPARKGDAEKLGLGWYGSAEEMLADERVEAIYVATNNKTHFSLAKQAMRKGRHCLVEKPMSTTVNDAESLVKLAKERGLSLAVDHMMTRNAWNMKARSLVESGELGSVNDICLHMEFCYGASPEEASAWRCSDPAELGGPIGDVASHCFYMAEYLLKGRITKISATYHPRCIDIKVENGACIKFDTDNGVEGSARVSFAEKRGGLVGTLSNLGYEIYGDRGVLRSYGTMFQLSGHPGEPFRQRLELETSSGVGQVGMPPSGNPNIYASVIEDHAGSILEGRPTDGSDGLWNLRLVLAAHESAGSNGKPVHLA